MEWQTELLVIIYNDLMTGFSWSLYIKTDFLLSLYIMTEMMAVIIYNDGFHIRTITYIFNVKQIFDCI